MIDKLILQLRGSILLLHFQPIFVLWTIIFELIGTKKSFNFYIYLILFSLLIFWLFVVNSSYVSDGISYLHGILLFLFWLSTYFYLFHLTQKNNEVIFLCYFLYFFIFLSFFTTFFLFNDIVQMRQVRYIFNPTVDVTTTGYINILTMITAILLVLRRSTAPLILFTTLLISFIWSNRTGVATCLVMFIYLIKSNKILSVKSFFIILFSIFFIFFFTEYIVKSAFVARISQEGAQSLRWVMIAEAFNALLNGENLMGGFKSNLINARAWIHNGFLDLYRVGGIFPSLIAVVFYLQTFFTIIKNNNNLFDRFFLWIIGFLIFNTSVAFEGFVYESIFIFILSANSWFLKMSYNKTSLN